MMWDKFAELSWDNMGDWPRSVKIILLGLLLLAVMLVAYVFFFRSLVSQIQRSENRLVQAQQQQVRLKRKVQALPRGRDFKLVPLAQLSIVLDYLAKVEQQSGVSLQRIRPLGASADGKLPFIPLQLTVTGDYQSLAQFLECLAKSTWVLRWSDFNVESAPKGSLPLKLTGVLRVYLSIPGLSEVPYKPFKVRSLSIEKHVNPFVVMGADAQEAGAVGWRKVGVLSDQSRHWQLWLTPSGEIKKQIISEGGKRHAPV